MWITQSYPQILFWGLGAEKISHSWGMKPLEIIPAHVASIRTLVSGKSTFIADNPLAESPAATAFDEFCGQLADRLNECATRIFDHTEEVASFAGLITGC